MKRAALGAAPAPQGCPPAAQKKRPHPGGPHVISGASSGGQAHLSELRGHLRAGQAQQCLEWDQLVWRAGQSQVLAAVGEHREDSAEAPGSRLCLIRRALLRPRRSGGAWGGHLCSLVAALCHVCGPSRLHCRRVSLLSSCRSRMVAISPKGGHPLLPLCLACLAGPGRLALPASPNPRGGRAGRES